jgi:lactate dehydrogenase-like 2-hydroxyacid dehydrogenase
MRVVFFSAKPYDQASFREANVRHGHDLVFLEARLALATAVLAAGAPVVCPFVNDQLDAAVIDRLAAGGTRLVALRSAGFNHVDLRAAARLGLPVTRVPALFAERGRGAHRRLDPLAQSQDPPSVTQLEKGRDLSHQILAGAS